MIPIYLMYTEYAPLIKRKRREVELFVCIVPSFQANSLIAFKYFAHLHRLPKLVSNLSKREACDHLFI